MIELLGSYTDSTASQAKDDAQKCIVASIADPKTFLFDHLLSLKPVKLLDGHLIYEVGYSLLVCLNYTFPSFIGKTLFNYAH